MRDTGPSREVRAQVAHRARQCCERCARYTACPQVHHRKPRKMGGTRRPEVNDPANLMLLCGGCHEWIESHRTEARRLGYLVPDYADPAVVPAFVGRQWVRLSARYHETDELVS